MAGKGLGLAVLLLLAARGAGEPRGCEAVRKVFQLRQLGSLRGLPHSPRAGKGGGSPAPSSGEGAVPSPGVAGPGRGEAELTLC